MYNTLARQSTVILSFSNQKDGRNPAGVEGLCDYVYRFFKITLSLKGVDAWNAIQHSGLCLTNIYSSNKKPAQAIG